MNLDDIKLRPLVETLQVLDISDEEYFGSGYRDYISNSRLKLINPEQDGSPEKYFKGIQGTYSDSLAFGTAVHQLVLQPNEFELVESVDKPTAKMGVMADELYKHYIEHPYCVSQDQVVKASDKVDYFKGKIDYNRYLNVVDKCGEYWAARLEWESSHDKDKTLIYLDPKSKERLKACLNSVKNNTDIQKLLHPEYIMTEPKSLNEVCVLLDMEAEVEGEIVPLKLKAKLDNFTICPDENMVTLNDLKTTGHYLTRFEESWENYHYYRQMGMYGWLLMLAAERIYGMENPDMKMNMLLVSTVPNYYAGVYKVSKKQMLRGFAEFSKLLKMVAYYTCKGWEKPI